MLQHVIKPLFQSLGLTVRAMKKLGIQDVLYLPFLETEIADLLRKKRTSGRSDRGLVAPVVVYPLQIWHQPLIYQGATGLLALLIIPDLWDRVTAMTL